MTDERQGGQRASALPYGPDSEATSPASPLPTRAEARSLTEHDTGGPSRHDDQPHRRGRRRRWVVVLLVLALVLALGGVVYLTVLSQRWADRAEALEGTAGDLGAELAQTRAELEESASTLALIESQLDGAQEQIHELADAAAQIGDDREVQRQVADYQAQVSAAATSVAEAMDECINSQQDLIDVLEEAAMALSEQAASPAPTETPSPGATPGSRLTLDEEVLEEYRGEVTEFCQAAQEANDNLQERLESS